MKLRCTLLTFYMIAISGLLQAQIQPYQKYYFAKDKPSISDTAFDVFGVFTDSAESSPFHTKMIFQYVPGYRNLSPGIADTLVHPLGRYIVSTDSHGTFSVTANYDTIQLPSYNQTADIHFQFQHSKKYVIRQKGIEEVNIPETGSDSISYWDLYLDSANVLVFKHSHWYGTGKKTGLNLFHDLNRPDSVGAYFFRIPYRKTEWWRLLHYEPGDWLEYKEQCDFGNYLGGPEDYVLIEVTDKYNDSQYRLKITTLNVTVENMRLVYDTSVTYADKEPHFYQLLKLYTINDGNLAPQNLYSDAGKFTSPRFMKYDTAHKEFQFFNLYFETLFFEPIFQGCSGIENKAVLEVFRTDFNLQTSPCMKLNAIKTKSYTDTINRMIGLRRYNENILHVFPNPANNYLILQGRINTDVTVYNTGGQIVLKTKTDESGRIQTTTIATGVYFLKIQDFVPIVISVNH